MFNNYNSNHIETNHPQDSILGPLLFCININDLVLVSEKVIYIMYDDNTVYITLQDVPSHNFEEIVNYGLGKFTNCLNLINHHLTHTQKKFMIFHTKQRPLDTAYFPINNENIENI